MGKEIIYSISPSDSNALTRLMEKGLVVPVAERDRLAAVNEELLSALQLIANGNESAEFRVWAQFIARAALAKARKPT